MRLQGRGVDATSTALTTSGIWKVTSHGDSFFMLAPNNSVDITLQPEQDSAGNYMFPEGHTIEVCNNGLGNIIFDDLSGSNETVGPSHRATFIYEGSVWVRCDYQSAILGITPAIVDNSGTPAFATGITQGEVLALLGVEAGATADQTNAEIRAAVEAATDSNVFTDADHTKLNGIEASATADQTDAEIRAAVEAATDSNVFTDADHTKLNGIETSADVTDETNVKAAIDGMTLTDIGTPASADRVLIQDASDSNNLKYADFSEFGGGGGGTPAGSNTEIQFNNGGSFGASARLTFNSSTNALTAGNSLLSTPVSFFQTAGDAAGNAGGTITSTTSAMSMLFDKGVTPFHEINGLKFEPQRYQSTFGKTTTQSFGQSIKEVLSAGTYDCYPSQGGMIVVSGNTAAITLNLVLGQDPSGRFDFLSKPMLSGGPPAVPPIFTSDLPGYGTWQYGDQVTVVAALTLGQTPNITIRSYNSVTNGVDGTATAAPTDASGTATNINGVNSSTTGGGQQTITTNYTAKTFVLVPNSSTLRAEWVCIG